MKNSAIEPVTIIENGKVIFVDFTEHHMGYNYEKRFMRLFGNYIQKDLLRWCIYSITKNDPAHQLDHVFDVCVKAKEIFDHFEELEGLNELDRIIVYHAALMHDLGCRYNRKDHHIIGYGLVYDYINRYCPNDFSPETLEQIAICVLEHRSSNKRKPTTFLSEIVSIADTSVPDISVYFTRALKFRLSGKEGQYDTDKELIAACITHIDEKFSDNGYHWKSYPDIGLAYYADEWDEFKRILADKELCLKMLTDNLLAIRNDT